MSGTAFQTRPVLQAQDADGQIDTHFTDTVSLTTDAGGVLSRTTGNLQATGGVAAFADVTYTATEDGQSFAVAADQAGGSGGDLPDANSGAASPISSPRASPLPPCGDRGVATAMFYRASPSKRSPSCTP